MSLLLDARGLKCPWPVLRLARAMRDADDVTVLADDPSAPDEIAALATERGWHVALGPNGIRVKNSCGNASLF